MHRLSELPNFLPAGEPGSPERRACAIGTFTNARVNVQFMRFAARLTAPADTHHDAMPAQAVRTRGAHG